MTATRIVSLVLVPVLTLLGDLRAQESRSIAPGAKVRVSAPSVVEKHVVGSVVSLGRDTLVLNAEGRAAPLMIPLVSVSVLEVHRGRKSRIGRGALIGLAVGAGAGAILGALAFSSDCIDDPDPCPLVGAAAGAVYLALPSTLVGAVIGALARTDRWEAVPLERIRVGLTPHGGHGLALTASVSF